MCSSDLPRTVEQAKIYDNLVQELGKEVGIVISMEIDKEVALKRTTSRLVCSACGTSYNKEVLELTPKIDGFCDKCGHTLEVRGDDNALTFTKRFDTYVTETKPLIDYYRQKGNLIELKIEEQDSAQTIFEKIKSIIG